MILLPDEMPEGCNFLALLETDLAPEDVAQRLAAAGWKLSHSGRVPSFEMSWGRLNFKGGNPVILWGWLDQLDTKRVLDLVDLLRVVGLRPVGYQWIGAEGLWRDLPFEESMLDPDDPRLPDHIKQSMMASREKADSALQRRKPWWRFW